MSALGLGCVKTLWHKRRFGGLRKEETRIS
jgi:hypothetical protein